MCGSSFLLRCTEHSAGRPAGPQRAAGSAVPIKLDRRQINNSGGQSAGRACFVRRQQSERGGWSCGFSRREKRFLCDSVHWSPGSGRVRSAPWFRVDMFSFLTTVLSDLWNLKLIRISIRFCLNVLRTAEPLWESLSFPTHDHYFLFYFLK